MPEPQPTTPPHDPKVRRIADEAVRRVRGVPGWRGYEAAKAFVRRTHPNVSDEQYDAIIDAIKTRLEI